MEFLGLIVLENRIKAKTKPVIRQLQGANLRTVMVTGDHIQTAVSVAKECQMVDRPVVFVTAKGRDSTGGPIVTFRRENGKGNKFLMESNQSFDCGPDYQFALDGPTYEAVRNHDPDLNRKLVCRGAVFARMSPTHKELLVGDLIQLGYYVGMCGDGANDCGALKVIVLPMISGLSFLDLIFDFLKLLDYIINHICIS